MLLQIFYNVFLVSEKLNPFIMVICTGRPQSFGERRRKLGGAEFTFKGLEEFRRVGNHSQSTHTTAAAAAAAERGI